MGKRHRIHTVNRRKKDKKEIYLRGKAVFMRKVWNRATPRPTFSIHFQEFPTEFGWVYDWFKRVQEDK